MPLVISESKGGLRELLMNFGEQLLATPVASPERHLPAQSISRAVEVLEPQSSTELVPPQHDNPITRAADMSDAATGRLEPGVRVRVKHGALAGLQGVIVARCAGNRLTLGVEFRQHGVSVQINNELVEPA
jgi:hypothetical protein